MKKIETFGLAAGLLYSLAAGVEDKKSRKVETIKAYAYINGLKMYYEIHA